MSGIGWLRRGSGSRIRRGRSGLTRGLVWLGLLAVVALASGCPLSPQEHPVPLSAAPVPTTTVTTTADQTDTRPGRSGTVTVYLVRDDRLVATDRTPGPDADPLTRSLQALLGKAADVERSRGLRSAIPPGTPQPAWRASAGELWIELPATFDALSAHEQMLAIGQLVFTATENSTLDRVVFLRDGQPVAVPDGAGRLLSRPVARSDYRQIAPG